MFVVLTLVSLEMIKQINQEKPLADFGDKRKRVEPKHASIEQLFVRAVYSLALVLITLTGVFPAIDKENENREEAPKIERTRSYSPSRAVNRSARTRSSPINRAP